MLIFESCIYSTGRELIDNKLIEVKQRLNNETGCSETSQGLEAKQSVHFLEYLLGSRRLSMNEIYSNTTELLLSGVDTVSVLGVEAVLLELFRISTDSRPVV